MTYFGCFLGSPRLCLFGAKSFNIAKVCTKRACARDAFKGDYLFCTGNACTGGVSITDIYTGSSYARNTDAGVT